MNFFITGRTYVLKALAWKLARIVLALVVIVASGLSLHSHYAGMSVDPVTEVQKLMDKKQRDGARDMVLFFREANEGSETLDDLYTDLDYTLPRKVRSFAWDGVVKGDVHDSYSGAGAVSADLLIIGDIRDLGIQSWKYITKADDFDKWILILSAGGIGLAATSFVKGTGSLAKNTVKFVKRMPRIQDKGVLKAFMSGQLPRRYHESVWKLFKANDNSIPRTASMLSRINNPKHIDTAVDLVFRNRRAGNAYIELAGERGLSLYARTPEKMRGHFIKVFTRSPRAVLGLTNSHIVLHTIKIFKKYHLLSVVIPIAAISMLLNLLSLPIVWAIFAGSTGYAMLTVFGFVRRRSKNRKRKGDKTSPIPDVAF